MRPITQTSAPWSIHAHLRMNWKMLHNKQFMNRDVTCRFWQKSCGRGSNSVGPHCTSWLLFTLFTCGFYWFITCHEGVSQSFVSTRIWQDKEKDRVRKRYDIDLWCDVGHQNDPLLTRCSQTTCRSYCVLQLKLHAVLLSSGMNYLTIMDTKRT